MRRNSTCYYSWVILIAAAIFVNYAFAYGKAYAKTDTSYFSHTKRSKKPTYLKNGLAFTLPPLKPGEISNVKFSVAKPIDDKLLSDVIIYPNPITTDQLNMKYSLSRNSNVSIKIMDVLGNDILDVFSQRVDLGEQKFTYSLNNKLSRGFYFVRIAAGTESVIKRISIL